jgi:PEP-CTERM motif
VKTLTDKRPSLIASLTCAYERSFFGEEFSMQRVFALLTLVAAFILAPSALHADTLMTGQFVIVGTVQNVGTTLEFDPATLMTGTGTQTGTFATILTDGLGFAGGTANIPYNPYVPDSATFFLGPLTIALDSLNETTVGSTLNFAGVTTLSATGFINTLANLTFSVPASGPSPLTATFAVPPVPSVPEPSSLALFGSGALGLAALAASKFRNARA